MRSVPDPYERQLIDSHVEVEPTFRGVLLEVRSDEDNRCIGVEVRVPRCRHVELGTIDHKNWNVEGLGVIKQCVAHTAAVADAVATLDPVHRQLGVLGRCRVEARVERQPFASDCRGQRRTIESVLDHARQVQNPGRLDCEMLGLQLHNKLLGATVAEIDVRAPLGANPFARAVDLEHREGEVVLRRAVLKQLDRRKRQRGREIDGRGEAGRIADLDVIEGRRRLVGDVEADHGVGLAAKQQLNGLAHQSLLMAV